MPNDIRQLSVNSVLRVDLVIFLHINTYKTAVVSRRLESFPLHGRGKHCHLPFCNGRYTLLREESKFVLFLLLFMWDHVDDRKYSISYRMTIMYIKCSVVIFKHNILSEENYRIIIDLFFPLIFWIFEKLRQ